MGYTPVNMLAMEDPELLKGYFDDRPNHKTAVDQLPVVREWFQFPGENTLKIDAIIGDTLEGGCRRFHDPGRSARPSHQGSERASAQELTSNLRPRPQVGPFLPEGRLGDM